MSRVLFTVFTATLLLCARQSVAEERLCGVSAGEEYPKVVLPCSPAGTRIRVAGCCITRMSPEEAQRHCDKGAADQREAERTMAGCPVFTCADGSKGRGYREGRCASQEEVCSRRLAHPRGAKTPPQEQSHKPPLGAQIPNGGERFLHGGGD